MILVIYLSWFVFGFLFVFYNGLEKLQCWLVFFPAVKDFF